MLAYLSVNTNNSLDLSQLTFKYNGFGEYLSGNIYLNIRDYKNVFPYLSKVDNVVSIRMKKEQINDEISLSLNETMYVNKDTLEMYQNSTSNVIETTDLFVPIGKEADLLDDDIFISIVDSGHSQADFTIPFNFYYNKRYFGECYESDYCIHGGIKE